MPRQATPGRAKKGIHFFIGTSYDVRKYISSRRLAQRRAPRRQLGYGGEG